MKPMYDLKNLDEQSRCHVPLKAQSHGTASFSIKAGKKASKFYSKNTIF